LGEQARLELLPDGTVLAWTGTQDQGQGHATALAPVVAAPLGLAPERVRLRQGDTAALATGSGSGGSASMVISGSSLHRGAVALAARIRAEAAELLEAAEADLRLEGGRVLVAGTDRGLALAELAREALARGRPIRIERTEPPPPQTWATGVTVVELEVDPETGLVRLLRLSSAVDCGTVLDAASATGQVQGGLAAGLGQALLERIVHDPAGQLLTGSLLDYAIPRAADVAPFAIAFEPTPSTRNPLGVKGLGELPTNGALAAVANALADALRPLGVAPPDPPFTPERVWRALRGRG
jgi:carbon-monoxide dehydrogenase large subunit